MNLENQQPPVQDEEQNEPEVVEEVNLENQQQPVPVVQQLNEQPVLAQQEQPPVVPNNSAYEDNQYWGRTGLDQEETDALLDQLNET